ncbi:hypothetical protein [Kluyvera cryocrescens]|uniref:hypothetical protein n=1 Tax=Kluyvera cryocrescens TaxID=580 RepID=UPI00248AEA4E|nr:hypothetical protein [Kluyvera cryocrescens]
MKKNKITGIDGAKKYLIKEGKNFNNEFSDELLHRVRSLSKKMQLDMSATAAGGLVPFTNNSMLVTYTKRPTGIRINLLVKDIQAAYLYDVIVKPSAIDKFVPTSAAKLTKQGNITGLKSNLKSGKYKVVESHGTKRIIDTRVKDRDKRVIALKEEKTRKIFFDWYAEGYKGLDAIITKINGQYTIGKKS